MVQVGPWNDRQWVGYDTIKGGDAFSSPADAYHRARERPDYSEDYHVQKNRKALYEESKRQGKLELERRNRGEPPFKHEPYKPTRPPHDHGRPRPNSLAAGANRLRPHEGSRPSFNGPDYMQPGYMGPGSMEPSSTGPSYMDTLPRDEKGRYLDDGVHQKVVARHVIDGRKR